MSSPEGGMLRARARSASDGCYLVLLRRNDCDRRLATYAARLCPSPCVHGDLGCGPLKRRRAGRTDCFAI
eukprot:5865949-Prymnesium_polylepis.1